MYKNIFIIFLLVFGLNVRAADLVTTGPSTSPIDAKLNGQTDAGVNSWIVGGQLVDAYSVANLAALQAFDGPNTTLYLKGRTTAGDGGQGVFFWNAADFSTMVASDALHGLYVPPTSDVTGASGAWVRGITDGIHVPWFGKSGVDDTAVVQAVFDLYKAHYLGTKKKIIFSPDLYFLTNVFVSDIYDSEIDFAGAIIKGIATSARPAVIEIFNYTGIRLKNLTLYSDSNTNYERGLYLYGGPGGTIEPVLGLGTEANLSNIKIRRFKTGLQIGDAVYDTNLGQNVLSEVQIRECNKPLVVGGSQTVVSASSCGFGSGGNDIYSVPDQEKAAVTVEGGSLLISASDVVKASGVGYGVVMANSPSSVYGYPYGRVIIGDSLVEAKSLVRVFKKYKTPSVQSLNSVITIHNSSGYVSGDAAHTVKVDDGDFAGVVTVSGRFYNSGTARAVDTVYIEPGSTAKFITGRNTWGAGFKHWLGGVSGGVVGLDSDVIFRVGSLAGEAVVTGVQKTLKWQTVVTTDGLNKYAGNYNPTTGEFTVPLGGFKILVVDVAANSAAIGTGVDTLTYVRVNGVQQHRFYGSRIGFQCTLTNLVAGDVIDVWIVPSANATFGAVATDYLQFKATN